MFSTKTVKFGEKILHHQMWFFGKDIMHESGNLLVKYGFERFGVPAGKTGGNSYRIKISDSQEVALFGFGIFFGDSSLGGVFLKRYEFQPKLLSNSKLELPIWQSDLLPKRRLPANPIETKHTKFLLKSLIIWLLEYERWIDLTCGKQWRKSCLKEWSNTEFGIRKIRNSWNKLQNI